MRQQTERPPSNSSGGDLNRLTPPKKTTVETTIKETFQRYGSGTRADQLTRAILEHKDFKNVLANYRAPLLVRIRKKITDTYEPISDDRLVSLGLEEAYELKELVDKRRPKNGKQAARKLPGIREVPASDIPHSGR
jgi:hypothetical protein